MIAADPPRLSAKNNAMVGSLLRAGRSEAPKRDRRPEVIAAALLATSCHSSFFAIALLAVKKKASWLLFGAATLALGGGVIGAVVVSTATMPAAPMLHHTDEPITRTMEVRARTPELGAEPAAPKIVIAPAVRATTRPLPGVEEPAEQLPSELELLRRARMDLMRDRNATASLATLDTHTRLYPRGSLHEEATALRIEALVRSGDSSTARAAALQFTAAYPTSAYGERVRSITKIRD